MSIIKKTIVLLFVLLITGNCFTDNTINQKDAAYGVIKRLIPDRAEKFVVELLPKDSPDVFEIESQNDKIILRGTSGVEISSALNWYLKYYCNCHISWCGNNLNLPKTLPKIQKKICKTSPYKYRYCFNYCTFSYTMAFWNWERWEKEIDWMVLNGINMPLAITGEEAVWREVYRDMGLSDKDLEKFFVGPAYFGWGWMGNIDGWGGPLTQSWIDSHRELQKKILARMRSLGMKPVLPAFSGHVPKALIDKFPNAKIQKMKSWEGFSGTYILDPMDPLFVEIGKRFIQKQNEIYGTDHLYSADTFNEMDPVSTDLQYLADVSKVVSQSMVEGDSLAVNVMQSWLFLHDKFWNNERIKAYLDAVPNDRMILLDLFATAKPQWKRTEAFYGKPWIWCMLHNWGGKMGMYGRTNAVTKELPSLLKNSDAGNLIGIGLTPEGLMTNPYIYDLMSEMAWHSDSVNTEQWTMDYINRRYGKKSAKAEEAWKILINTIYDCRDLRHGPQGAHYCMRPTPEFSRGSFVRSEIFYNPEDIRKALKLLLEAADEIGNSDGYNYDIVDLTRQCMSDLSLEMHQKMSDAYNSKNYDEYKNISDKWLSAIIDLDALLKTRKEFLLGNWIGQSKQWATDKSESCLYEWNARNLITLWGPRNSSLHDYAQKQWAGLMKDFYYPRWEMLIAQVKESLKSGVEFNSENFNSDVSAFEESWTKQNNNYETNPVGNPIDEARRLFKKYLSE
jgi:alpha-N-acetylglucosaminidase